MEILNRTQSTYKEQSPLTADNYKTHTTKGKRTTVGFICDKHGYISGDHCPHCAQEQPNQTLHINTGEWVKGWYEHIDKEPIYIESKRHLAYECEKRGLIARALAKPCSQGKGMSHKI